MSGLQYVASRVLAPDFYAEMRFSTLWHTQRNAHGFAGYRSAACRKLPNMEGEFPVHIPRDFSTCSVEQNRISLSYGNAKRVRMILCVVFPKCGAEQDFFTLREREESSRDPLRRVPKT